MKERLYLAVYDNGHDGGEFEFYSTHRANSKDNKEDALEEAYKQFGRYASNIEIKNTYLIEDRVY